MFVTVLKTHVGFNAELSAVAVKKLFSISHENFTKPLIFKCFQEVRKHTTCIKWFKLIQSSVTLNFDCNSFSGLKTYANFIKYYEYKKIVSWI